VPLLLLLEVPRSLLVLMLLWLWLLLDWRHQRCECFVCR